MEPLSRVTPATVDVLTALLGEPDDTWGLRIVAQSGRPAGSVYPILERLERAGWVESRWEAENERPGPRRRLYRVTAEGASAARELVTARSRPAASIRARGALA